MATVRSWYLDSIGVYLMSLLQRNPSNTFSTPQYHTTNGTNKRNKGYNYDLEDELSNKVDDRVYTRVLEVHLTRYGGVVSIRVCYDLNGQAIWGSKNGGSGGIRLDKDIMDQQGPTVVKSLTFDTNKKKYGPFGDEQGISFSSGSNNGVIVGFHGRKGWFIDSIGVHVILGAAKEAAPPVSGPWGGGGDKPWDDGVFSGVHKFFLTKGEAIYCIQIKYDINGQSVWSVRHEGGSEGSSNMINKHIKFDYLNEKSS
ncbi:jacalin-related lectin 3-like [Populus nigra]|uniref:jacalin-related lectin 3-like n=1 Tax=Populus nigra TaxID=3691 RepID=UPI002B2795F1|nr:jacalin-related lectin 3-like [Populus nigra]